VGVADVVTQITLPFEQAIEALRKRLRMPKGKFLELDKANRSRSFTVAWVTKMGMLKDIHNALIESLQSGQTIRDFRNALPDMLDREGWTGENWWHAEVVYNQNRNMAYGAGRIQQMDEAGITHWRFEKNTERHAELDGRIFATDDTTYYPPLGWNCQCTAEPVFEDEVPKNVDTSDDVAKEGIEPPGAEKNDFVYDPRAYGTGPSLDMDMVPEELRPDIEDLARRQGVTLRE
jgi:SPP1 gp7 family putative phage head morphogenesis protein